MGSRGVATIILTAMAAADQEKVNRVAANVGKAFEAYARKATTGRAPLDRYLLGDTTALTAAAQQGLKVFVAAGCLGCHSGPMLTDEGFHALGVPNTLGLAPDRGRAAGLERVNQSPFNAGGKFFDGAPLDGLPPYAQPASTEGAFRTPSLRNLGRTAPYGHNGSFAGLPEVVDFHLRGGGRGAGGFAGEVDPLLQPKALSEPDRAALLELLRSLDGQYPGLPWADWPRG